MTRSQKLGLFLAVLLSSVLLPLALPNEFMGGAIRLLGLQPDESFFWGNAVLGIICIAPVFYAIARAPTFGFASLLGLLFGGVSTALSNYWLMFFQGYSVWTYGGTVIGYMGYNALLFPFLQGPLPPKPAVSSVPPGHGLVRLRVLQVGRVSRLSVGPHRLPVGGFLPLVQFVDTTGVWGLSFLMALVNALVAEYALARDRPHFYRQGAFVLVLVACALVYGYYRIDRPIPYAKTASLLLVQQNSDPWDEGQANDDSLKVNLDLTAEGVRQHPRPTWPSGARAR